MLILTLFAQHLNLHSLLEKGKWLCEVAYAELILGVFPGIFDLKIEPLLMAFCVCVDFAEQVVLLNDWFFSCLHVCDVFVVDLTSFTPL